MAEDTVSTPEAPKPRERRRAKRPAGPVNAAATTSAAGVRVEAPTTVKVRLSRPGPPARRQPHRALVVIVSLLTGLAAVIATGAGVWVLFDNQRDAEALQARDQRFVDTASQLVVNMFSYTQENIDDSVNRFVNSTSGPLRDMLSQDNNVENLKSIFRDTSASSEAVINGAALESVDEVAKNAEVLVSVRVTVTDMEGTNKPSQPYRLRVIVHEDDNGHMTGYDLKYPEGGN
jgi:Mce-associated membrane protein